SNHYQIFPLFTYLPYPTRRGAQSPSRRIINPPQVDNLPHSSALSHQLFQPKVFQPKPGDAVDLFQCFAQLMLRRSPNAPAQRIDDIAIAAAFYREQKGESEMLAV